MWVNSTYDMHNYTTETWTSETDSLRILLTKSSVFRDNDWEDAWSLSCHGSLVICSHSLLDVASLDDAQDKALQYVRKKVLGLSEEMEEKCRVFCEACPRAVGDLGNNRYLEVKFHEENAGFHNVDTLGMVLCPSCAKSKIEEKFLDTV